MLQERCDISVEIKGISVCESDRPSKETVADIWVFSGIFFVAKRNNLYLIVYSNVNQKCFKKTIPLKQMQTK